MKIKNEEIKKLKKENEKLKQQIEEMKKPHSSAWDFHWDGKGDYEEARRCFYGDFS